MPKVTMPQLGETVADGTVAAWLKRVGDSVTRGEALFEVSTDKVDTEIPAPADGVLTAILVSAGQTVDVGTVLALIDEEPDQIVASRDATPPAAAAPPARAAVARLDGAARSTAAAPLSPVVRRLLAEHGLDASQITGTGPGGRLTRDDVLAAAAPPRRDQGVVSPVVRRLLAEHGLDASQITGTGPGGRLTRRDVDGVIASRATASRTGDEVIPFTKIRRVTAEHMIRSKATSAHTLMVREIDYEHVDAVRRTHGDAFRRDEGFSLTYLPFNVLATLEALRDFPHLNASVGDDALIVHHDLHLGVAVDIEGTGLVVPVVHHADRLDLRSVARAIRDLATRARTKRLTLDDTAGGTFTITNPGPFNTLLTGAVINQPQVAILSTDGVSRKPVVVATPDGEAIAIHSIGLAALTFDHRVIDGAYAARFLARLAEILVTRNWEDAL